ncbi:L-lactate dehydrogenase complex protein LldE [Planctomycetales bacterium 10988]|nr:L-lactate dehydrogenase complex protein LldE [Planctomycetales bacterium 10988]
MIPCFIDQLFPQVGIRMVEIFERLGHEVEYPMDQTCCGQPPFNSGFQDEARQVAVRVLEIFKSAEVVVVPSGSCAAMVKVFYPELFQESPQEEAAKELAAKTWEFSQFLVEKLEVTDVGASFPGKVTFHDGCHGLRELGVKGAPRALLEKVRDLELVEMGEAETCCGFGGTFAVKFPQISTAMAQVKSNSAEESGAEYIVSNDASCLMQIQGYLDRQPKNEIRCFHLAEVLAKNLDKTE